MAEIENPGQNVMTSERIFTHKCLKKDTSSLAGFVGIRLSAEKYDCADRSGYVSTRRCLFMNKIAIVIIGSCAFINQSASSSHSTVGFTYSLIVTGNELMGMQRLIIKAK